MCVKFSTNEKSAEPGGSLDTENVRGLAGKVFFAAQVTLTVRAVRVFWYRIVFARPRSL